MHKKVVAVVLTAGLILGTATPTMAAPNNGSLNQKKQELQNNKNALEKAKQKREDLEKRIQLLDSQIESAMRELNLIKSKISKTEKDIQATKNELEQAQKEVEKEQDIFNQRMRAMYINGVDSYLAVILDSQSFSDFLTRIDTVKDIVNFDKKLMKQLNDKKEIIVKKKNELDSKKQELEALKKFSEEKVTKMQKDKADQDKLITEVREEENRLGTQVRTSQGEIDSIIRQAQQEAERSRSAASNNNSGTRTDNTTNSTNTRTPSRGGSTSTANVNLSGNEVVAYAAKFIGIPYVWGGKTPSGFDCSGFMHYVYAHFGYEIGGWTGEQINAGRAVSDLQPGDLIFFGDSSIPSHVGMYVGGGKYIHAPHTGAYIRIDNLTRQYCAIRRIK